jgi:hypothetical protein
MRPAESARAAPREADGPQDDAMLGGLQRPDNANSEAKQDSLEAVSVGTGGRA